ncbi:MAG: hypothetical protein H0X29_11885, partial [Parachlamydiaceae bacterium]|nr:hypothetical protein [Parachlamydiaceae bacterium]
MTMIWALLALLSCFAPAYALDTGDRAPHCLILNITSSLSLSCEQGEILYISYVVTNHRSSECTEVIRLLVPEGWTTIPQNYAEITLNPSESCVGIFAVKVVDMALAGDYTIFLEIEGSDQQQEIMVAVCENINFDAKLMPVEECYHGDVPISLAMFCVNNGNTALQLKLDAQVEPICPLSYESGIFTLQPGKNIDLYLQLEPSMCLEPFRQFLLLKIMDADTCNQLFVQAVNLEIIPCGSSFDDPFIRIPAHASIIALGDNEDDVFVAEFAGGGYIDTTQDRFLDFCFRLPSKSRNVIYNVDQRIFLGLKQPDLNLRAGDTVYVLSPLTQLYRYGRGGGIDIYEGNWSIGSHYTQNIFNNDYNPRETCAYVEYSPSPRLNISGNYLHKTLQHIPTSHLVTCAAEIEFRKNAWTEIEFGKNFVDHVQHKDTWAYRFETRGKCFKDTWYDIEKVYAGAAFFGYYQHINLFSTTIDFPVARAWRGNVNYSDLKQNFDNVYCYENYTLAPRQRQFIANLSYNFHSGANVTLNGTLLRAKDEGSASQYNFNQRWAGVNLTFTRKRYYFNTRVQFGQQRDYLTHHTTNLLQLYYVFLGKDFTDKLNASLFYEGGSTNYYDARHWRTSYGTAISYKYSNRAILEFMAQRVMNKPDQYEMTQVSGRGSYTFKNLSQLQGTVQYFNYQKHYPDDLLFLVSYTVPFGLPITRRLDIGVVEGYVWDANRACPIAEAQVNLNGNT